MSAAKRVAHAAETVRARWEQQVSTDPQTEAAQALEDTGQLLDPEVAAELVAFRKERELAAGVAEYGAFPVPVGPQPQVLSEERLTEIVESHPGDWYSGEWRSEDYSAGEFSEYIVKHVESDTVLAELPDWAGPLALFFADAHDAVPELVAEVRRLRAQVAELEAERHETNEALDDVVRELRARQSCPCPPADQPGPHQLGCPQAEVVVVERPVNELTTTFMPVAALREVLDGEHYAHVHHSYLKGHDLPGAGGV